MEATQEIQVVKAERKHLYSIVALTRRFFPYMPFSIADVERRLGQQNIFYYVALINGHTVGYVDFKFSQEGATILGLAVVEEFRNRGVGTALLKKALGVIAANGFKEARVMAACNNAPALQLYRKLGFEVKGRLERMINNEDVFLLVKSFCGASNLEARKEVI